MNRRPIPDDFAVASVGVSANNLLARYRCGASTLQRWFAEIAGDYAAPKPRQMPADFPEHAGETSKVLIRRYACTAATVARWRREAGVIPRNPSEPAAMPQGFRLVAPEMTIHELRKRYGRSERVLYRWCAEAGVHPRRAKRRDAAAPRIVVGNAEKRFSPQAIRNRDMSRAGQAAEFLRRLGPVWRCDASGTQDARGTHWNRGGRTVLTDAELIERAKRNGWRPDAWAELSHAA